MKDSEYRSVSLEDVMRLAGEEERIARLPDGQLLEELGQTDFAAQTYNLLIEEIERRELDI